MANYGQKTETTRHLFGMRFDGSASATSLNSYMFELSSNGSVKKKEIDGVLHLYVSGSGKLPVKTFDESVTIVAFTDDKPIKRISADSLKVEFSNASPADAEEWVANKGVDSYVIAITIE